MSELKPCPFCAKPGSLHPSSDHSTAYEGGCQDEDCPAYECIWALDKASAIAAWNRRPSVEALVEHPVFDFLLGSGPLNGHWFGDEPPRGEGKRRQPYWWRIHLRAALAAHMSRT